MVTYDLARSFRSRSVAIVAALSMLLLVIGGVQPAGAVGSSALESRTLPQASGETIEVSDPALATEPQLYLSGPVVVAISDQKDNPSTQYSVLTDQGLVRISGDLDRLTSGSTFSGTVALPAALTDRLSRTSKERVQRSADSPISAQEFEGTQLLQLAQAEAKPLQVSQANVTLSEMSLGTAAHTVDVAVLDGASFNDSAVNTNVGDLGTFWVGQSNGAITGITRPQTVQRYTSAYLSTCPSNSNWPNQVWSEAAAKFGNTTSDYYNSSGRHLVVFAKMPAGAYCSEGIGSVGGTNGSGTIVANISSITLHTLAHEFGHNLGLGHANVHQCSNAALVEGSVAQGCQDYAYDDYYDVMSGGYVVGGAVTWSTNQLAALNVTDRVRLGFFPSGDLKVVSGSDSAVSLKPSSATNGVRGLQVADPITGDTYYIEYRSGTGMDTGAFYTKPFTPGMGEDLESLRPGVRILKLRGSGSGNSSVALAQLKQPGDPYKMLALKSGDTFSTPSGGLTVRFAGVTSGNANLVFGSHTMPNTDRIAGTSRYTTAVEVSKAAFPNPGAGIPVVYVAQGSNYPDALAAAPAAVAEGGPLLLTDSNSLPSVVKDEIERLNPGKIVVVGGTGVVSPAVFSELRALVPSNTIRLGGGNRYETARLVVRHAFIENGNPAGASIAYIATGSGFPDALSASAAAGAEGSPVVLVNGSLQSVDAATKALLQDLGVTETRIAGGTGVVSAGVQNSLGEVSTVVRYAGSNRFDTNHKVNSAIYTSAATTYLATGFSFPDALAGAALAGAKGAPLYLVQTACIPAQTRSDILDLNAETVWLIGGTSVLTSRVAAFASC